MIKAGPINYLLFNSNWIAFDLSLKLKKIISSNIFVILSVFNR